MINERQVELVRALRLKQISAEQFKTKFGIACEPRNISMIVLKDALLEKNKRDVELGISIGSSIGFTQEYLEILKNLFYEQWHHSHEDLIWYLDQLRDPKSTGVFFDATRMIPPYLEWDDSRALAVKAIYALGKLGTDEAVERLNEVYSSANEVLRNAVLVQFERILPEDKRTMLRDR